MRNLNTYTRSLLLACTFLLAACGNNQQQQATAPASPPTKAAATPAPQTASSASDPAGMPAAPPAAQPAAQAGVNPRFYSTQNYLDPGGSIYLYMDVKDGLRDLIATFRTEMGDAAPPELTNVLNIADSVLNRLGLYGLHDIGLSVMPEPNGRYLTKFFLSAPDGRQGVFALFGGNPQAIETLNIAPPDTALFGAGDFDVAGLLALVRQIAEDVAGLQGRQQIDQSLAMLQMQSGLNFEQIINSFDGHGAFIATLDPQRRLTIPGADPNTVVELPLVLIAFRVKDATLYDSLRTLLAAEGQTQAEVVNGTLRQFNIAVPPNPVWSLTPVIAMDGNYFYASTDADYLKRALATKGQDNLTKNPEFVELSAGLPTEGNALNFMSAKVPEYIQKVMEMAATLSEQQGRDPGEPDPIAMQRLMWRLQGQTGPAYTVRVNHPDGMLSITRSNQGGKQLMAAFAAAPAAILAAIAVPNFLEAQTRSKVSRVQSDLRSLATGIESYYVDNNAYPAWSGDPANNAFGGRAAANPMLQSQPTFRTDTGSGGPYSLTTPIAYITSYFNDAFGENDTTFSFWRPAQGDGWLLWSPGPDMTYDITLENVEQLYTPGTLTHPSEGLVEKTFDPTNGTTSTGDIWRAKMR